MIKCPQCQATLPDAAGGCQFCGAQWAAAPTAAPRGPAARFGGGFSGTSTAPWVWYAYYGIAGWWILGGVIELLQSTVGRGDNGIGYFGVVFGALTALFGLGLALRVEVVRNVAVFVAFVEILLGAFGILTMFLSPAFGGLSGAIAVLTSFLDIATSGLLIFVIGETERSAPNY